MAYTGCLIKIGRPKTVRSYVDLRNLKIEKVWRENSQKKGIFLCSLTYCALRVSPAQPCVRPQFIISLSFLLVLPTKLKPIFSMVSLSAPQCCRPLCMAYQLKPAWKWSCPIGFSVFELLISHMYVKVYCFSEDLFSWVILYLCTAVMCSHTQTWLVWHVFLAWPARPSATQYSAKQCRIALGNSSRGCQW